MKYPEYISFLYHKGDIPQDISVRDSITISAWVAIALNRYCLAFPDGDLAKIILPRLDLLKTYLRRRYNSKIKGFGLTTSAKMRGPVGIHVDPRHTAWAILTLWELGCSDIETNAMLNDSGSYLMKELNSLSPNEYAMTYAALHRLLSTQGVSSIITLSDVARNAMMKRLESYIVEKYNFRYKSWDLEPDNVERTRIDYAFDVLISMRIDSCVDEECADILRATIEHLCSTLILLPDEKMALPFYDGGNPDIGATIQLLSIVLENRSVLKINDDVIKKMLNFIVDPSSRREKAQFAYPWHLASALFIASMP